MPLPDVRGRRILVRKPHWKLRPFDVFCWFLAVTALILWSLTGSGNVAIGLAVSADGFAVLPILVKAWCFPHTDHRGCSLVP